MFRTVAVFLAATLVSPLAVAQSPVPPADELRTLANQFFKPVPDAETVIRERRLDPAAIELGRMLYFEPRISRSHIISCNTCHSLGTGGADNIPASIGHGWQRGPRNAPTVLNAVFNTAQFWDGRAADLNEQAKGPVQASVEMNNTPEQVEATLRSMPGYVAQFATAYPGQQDPVNFDNMTRAIEAFESTLVTPNSKFDRFLAGDNALDDTERRGLHLFMTRGCVACHQGVNVGGQAYFPFGVVRKPGAEVLPPGDKGRFTVTRTASDEYVFRAGPLRNIALTAPYFHSGEVWSLEEAVAIMGTSQLGQDLEEGEVAAITRFLHTLTGDQPQVVIPILPPSTPATPRPQG